MSHCIENGFLRLCVSESFGASPTSFELWDGRAWNAIMRAAPVEISKAGQCSSFTLAPFSNRIRDANFEFAGKKYQLRATTTDGGTQHGDVRDRLWKISQNTDSLHCFFDARNLTDLNYPWPFTMRVNYKLDGLTLITTLELSNVSQEPMPAGFGIHPYFVRSLFGSKDCTLSFASRGYYQTDASLIPSAGMQVVPAELNFAIPKKPSQNINTVFAGISGDVILQWLGSGWKMRISSDEIFSHLVVFAAPDGTLALEPVSHATDAFNLFAKGIKDTGAVVLEPGASMRGEIRISLEKTGI